MKKGIKVIIVFVLFSMMMTVFSGCGDEDQWTIVESDTCYPLVASDSYWDNFGESSTAYEEAIKHFITENGNYTNDFGGVYIDENGIHNICVVGFRRPVKSDYLIYRRVKNSINFFKRYTRRIVKTNI